MSAIDTVESVIDLAAIWSYEGATDNASMLTRYAAMIADHKALQAKHAALLEAVNRPVTYASVLTASRAYGGWCNTTQMQTALKVHMAALREQVGK